MQERRRFLQTGLTAGIGLAGWALGLPRAHGQVRAPVKVRYQEVVRSLFFAPAYVALSQGFFRDARLDVGLTTANGGDKAMAALLAGSADIALLGPEVPIAVQNGPSPLKARLFCGLTAADGYLLCAREPRSPFDLEQLRGCEIMGWRPGSTPLVFLQAALRSRGLDPQRDLVLVNDIAPPARAAAWLEGRTHYAIFSEPEASQLELDGKAHVVASVGAMVGPVDYTAFAATDRFLQDEADTVRAWTGAVARAMRWTSRASTEQLAAALAPYFPAASARALRSGIERYRTLQLWKTTPLIAASAIDRFQDLLVQSGVLAADRRVSHGRVVASQFGEQSS